ncbi:hypothetical protein GCM10009682_38770 [Luedemannella flava]|uniref:Glycosyltransferase 2-like domain-containing protein n=1 Tax=Luedemannella flava TaxID=349316 RepID=A0ABP4YIT2_9ACTN
MTSLAATMIVRDEAAVLAASLRALRNVVDEIHVHDTGSTDGTVSLAASLDAIVSRGLWTNDFASARNDAMAGWTADWVLAVDADEQAVADPAALRAFLAGTDADLLLVEIDNEQDRSAFTHRTGRLFRPSAGEWSGAVHEQVVARSGRLRVAHLPREVLHLRHTGYATEAVRYAKCVRNAALAQAAVDDLVAQGATASPTAVAATLLDLGRSLVGAERRQEAVDAFETLRELFPGTREWLVATDFLARQVLAAGLDEVCLVLVDQLRAAGAPPMYCDWLAAQAIAQLGDVAAAQRLLDGVTEVVDTDGRRYETTALRELKDLLGSLAPAAY